MSAVDLSANHALLSNVSTQRELARICAGMKACTTFQEGVDLIQGQMADGNMDGEQLDAMVKVGFVEGSFISD